MSRCALGGGVNRAPLGKFFKLSVRELNRSKTSWLVWSLAASLSACSGSEDLDSSSNASSSSQPDAMEASVQINEAAPVNSSFADADGDTPDWFELVNRTDDSVSLRGWSVGDKGDLSSAWVFPDVQLPGGAILRVWASDKDRAETSTYQPLITQGDYFEYVVPDETTPVEWMATDFDASGWAQGPSGFGFADQDDETIIDPTSSAIFLRREFTLNDPAELETLWLHMDYDDGFVAYINGVEVARSNMTDARPAYDALAEQGREATLYQNQPLEAFTIENAAEVLQAGQNVLAIQVHNVTSDSSDLSAIPFLTARLNNAGSLGETLDPRLGLPVNELHTNFKLTSSGETIYLYDADGDLVDSLVIPEVPDAISVGRSIVTNETVLYAEPTPGEANTTEEYIGVVTSELAFSHPGGVLSPATVSLSGAAEGEVIRYTLDSSEPTNQSAIYNDPFVIDQDTVIRAQIYRDKYIPSAMDSRTYLYSRQHDLPVVTLTIDPLEFFDIETGIYAFGTNYEARAPYYGANFWQDWEREVEVAYYETTGDLGFAMDAGIKIFGGWSRANPQRSLSLFARGKYGYGKLKYPLFAQRHYDEFEAVVLRNSGNDWMTTMLRDAFMTSLMEGANLDYGANQPAVVYLNDQYWGLYNIREKINEHFLASLFDVDADDINLLEGNSVVNEGSNTGYLEIVDYLQNNSLADNAAFDWVTERVDVDNFTVYQIAQIYFANTDWPGNNIKFWQSPSTKWRWILYDTDFGFGMYEDTEYDTDSLGMALAERGPAYPNPPWATLMLRKLLENEGFRNGFINRFADEINSRFEPTRVIQLLDQMAARIETEMPRQIARWEPEMDRDPEEDDPIVWEDNVQKIRDFAELRPEAMREFIIEHFELTAAFELLISNQNPQTGFVQVNSLQIDQAEWIGHYFSDIPVSVTAIPKAGYRFSHWENEELGTEPTVELLLTEDAILIPVFVPE